jgi:hypothetical protein
VINDGFCSFGDFDVTVAPEASLIIPGFFPAAVINVISARNLTVRGSIESGDGQIDSACCSDRLHISECGVVGDIEAPSPGPTRIIGRAANS